ncbi:MAG: PilZ domain-containing protein, partial [Rhodospirillales bacterium]
IAMYVAANNHVTRPTRYPYHRPAQGRYGDRAFEGSVENVSATGAAIALGEAGVAVDNGMFVDMHVEGLGHLSGRVARTYDGGFAVQFDADGADLDAVAEALSRLDRQA